MSRSELWQKAIDEHNKGDYHEAHELFEDLWMDLDNRTEKDTVQTLAQADALAVHLQSGNLGAAQRLMRQLPELLQTFPDNYRDIDLTEIRTWINRMIQTVPQSIETQVITNKKPPMLTDSRN